MIKRTFSPLLRPPYEPPAPAEYGYPMRDIRHLSDLAVTNFAIGGCQRPPNALNFTSLTRNSQSTRPAMLSPENRSRLTTLSKIALGLFWLALFIGTHMPVDTEFLPPEGR